MARTRVGEGGCRIWSGAYTSSGYPQFYVGGAKRTRRWFYALLTARQPKPGWDVTTSCGHKGCIAHLMLRPHAANMARRLTFKSADVRLRMALGRRARSRLTLDVVRELRARHAAGERVATLAREAGISRRYARRLLAGETWRDYSSPFGL